jgi:hypothetical protein
MGWKEEMIKNFLWDLAGEFFLKEPLQQPGTGSKF